MKYDPDNLFVPEKYRLWATITETQELKKKYPAIAALASETNYHYLNSEKELSDYIVGITGKILKNEKSLCQITPTYRGKRILSGSLLNTLTANLPMKSKNFLLIPISRSTKSIPFRLLKANSEQTVNKKKTLLSCRDTARKKC